MNEKDAGAPMIEDPIEFKLDDREAVFSAEPLRQEAAVHKSLAAEESKVRSEKLTPVLSELAAPKLPELPIDNRARLQMQSPNRLYFYWSLKSNPFQLLNRALGGRTGSYTLVIKLVDTHSGWEEIHAVDSQGSWWFSVEANRQYRAEIGFYAPNRPYIRVLFSNTIETPRKSPSPRPAATADWAVSADRFSKILQAAGFSRDAFDVAVAGDDTVAAEQTARSAFSQLIATSSIDLSGIASDDLRFVLFALASGAALESLRWRVSPELYAVLQDHFNSLDKEKALDIVRQQFGIDVEDIVDEEPTLAAFGASLVHFPRVLKKRGNLPELSPLSSFAIGK